MNDVTNNLLKAQLAPWSCPQLKIVTVLETEADLRELQDPY